MSGKALNIPNELVIEMYTKMQRIRKFEETAGAFFSEGKIPGFVHLYIGEEAIAVGACANLRDDDFITSTHRGHGHIVAKGGNLKLMMAEPVRQRNRILQRQRRLDAYCGCGAWHSGGERHRRGRPQYCGWRGLERAVQGD